MRTHSEFITVTENVVKTPVRTFVPARRNPWRNVKTREIQVETQVLCKILIEKEKKFFLSMEIYATFFEMRADRAV